MIDAANHFPCPVCGASPEQWCSELAGIYLRELPKDSTPWCHSMRREVMKFNMEGHSMPIQVVMG